MTVMAIYRRNDVSSKLYQDYRELVPLDAAPAGALAHAYGRVGAGLVVVDIWDSREALDRFIAERLAPAFADLRITFEPPEIIEVETFRATPAATAPKHLLPFEEAAAQPVPA